MSKGKCLPALLLGTTLLAAELPLLPAAEDETQLQSMLEKIKRKASSLCACGGRSLSRVLAVPVSISVWSGEVKEGAKRTC